MPDRMPVSIRDDIADLEPYVSPQMPARVRLNTNESPYAPPPDLLDEVAAGLKEAALNRYPDRDATVLHDALALKMGWPRSGVWIANGSNEVFQHLLLAFGGPGRTAMVFSPTYSLHSIIGRITATNVIESARGDDYLVDPDAAVAAIERERPRIVILCSPNNPTGACEPLVAIRAILESCPGLVVVDEAYVEFAPEGASVRALLEDHAHLVMVRTLSKAWRLAGARIGYMLGAPDLVAEMARVRLPYHLSTPSQLIGTAALRRESDALVHIEAIRKERDRIVDALAGLGLKSYRSDANFVLFKVPEAQPVWESLLDEGVLVRNYARVAGLEGCLRVTAGLPEETDAFVAALTGAL